MKNSMHPSTPAAALTAAPRLSYDERKQMVGVEWGAVIEYGAARDHSARCKVWCSLGFAVAKECRQSDAVPLEFRRRGGRAMLTDVRC